MTTLEAIYKRKSIRNYADKPIDEQTLRALLKAGQDAPNAAGVHFSVVRSAALLKEVSDEIKKIMLAAEGFSRDRASLPGYEPLYGAPAVFFISDAAGGSPSAYLAAENIITAAVSLGLGTCYIGSPKPLVDAKENGYAARLGIPEGNRFVCGVIVGHPLDDGEFLSTNRPREYGNFCFVD